MHCSERTVYSLTNLVEVKHVSTTLKKLNFGVKENNIAMRFVILCINKFFDFWWNP